MSEKHECYYVFDGYYGGRKLKCDDEGLIKCKCGAWACDDHSTDADGEEVLCITCYYTKLDCFD